MTRSATPRWLYRGWLYGRFLPHLLIATAGVWTLFVPPLSIADATTVISRVAWCVLLFTGAFLSSWGLGHFDERPRVVGLLMEGCGMLAYALALVGRGTDMGAVALSVGALSLFLFKSCVYADLRLRAEREQSASGGRGVRSPGPGGDHARSPWLGMVGEPGVEEPKGEGSGN